MDSGFGPYSLTRLCYETGGIFFAVHPNRDRGSHGAAAARRPSRSAQLSHFFDPEVMRNYRPDYVSIKEYQKLLAENKARSALVQAAQIVVDHADGTAAIVLSENQRRRSGQSAFAGAARGGGARAQDRAAL